MNFFWYVCAGRVEEYSGQEVDWSGSAVVFARSPEEALLKVLKYHRGRIERVSISWQGQEIGDCLTWAVVLFVPPAKLAISFYATRQRIIQAEKRRTKQ